jgi:hypothetical protein
MSISLPELHKIISRFDASKDGATIISKTSSSTLFATCADYAFGKMGPYDKTKDFIINYINTKFSTKDYVFNIYELDNINDININILLSSINYAIQDSGISPYTISSTIKLVVTPGSIIDACKRSKDDILLYGFGKKINNTQFKEIGFDYIKELTSKNEKTNSKISIEFNYGKKINIITDANLTLYGDDIKYFMGNTLKNKWFNDNIEPTNSNIIEGITYIICKELGDTLQAYYAKMFIQEYKLNNSLCLFTCDTILALRCRLLKVPVIVRNNVDKSTTLKYYPNKGNMDATMKLHEYNKCIDQNNSVIKYIRNVTLVGLFYINTAQFKLTDTFKVVLEKIIKSIEIVNGIISTIDTTYIDYDTYCKFLIQYKAEHLFTLFDGKNYRLYNNTCIYPLLKKDTNKVDIIKISGVSIYGIVNKLYKNITTQKGGTIEINNDIIDYINRNIDYIIDREYNIEEDKLSIILKHNIYMALKDKFKDITILDYYFITEDIYNLLYYYFDYTRTILYGSDFLDELIDYYELDTNLFNLSFDTFLKIFTEHKVRIEKEEEEKELELAKKCDELNFGKILSNSAHINKINSIFKKIIAVHGGKKTRKRHNISRNKTKRNLR